MFRVFTAITWLVAFDKPSRAHLAVNDQSDKLAVDRRKYCQLSGPTTVQFITSVGNIGRSAFSGEYVSFCLTQTIAFSQ